MENERDFSGSSPHYHRSPNQQDAASAPSQNSPNSTPSSSLSKDQHSLLTGMYTLNAAVFVLAIVLIGGLALFLPKPTESVIEKRDLAKMPSLNMDTLFRGEFAKQTGVFYADTFPARESLVTFAGRLEEMRGIRPDDVRIHENTPTPQQNQPTTPNVANPESPNEPTSNPDDLVPGASSTQLDPNTPGEQIGSTFMLGNMALPIFWANETASTRYAQTLNKYSEALGDDVKIYNLVAPTAISFYLPEKYQKITSDEKENIDFIYKNLSPKITSVDSYSEIDKIKDQYIYFRSDHHWTVRGAYAAYQGFCKAAGFEPVPLSKMERKQIDNFVGSLYAQTQDSKLLETPDFVEYFIPPQDVTTTRYVRNQPKTPTPSTMFADFASGQNAYSVFLYGDFPLTHMVTGLNTGRKIAVVKESFGNAFAPFLVSHYDEVFVIDQRYFQLGLVNFIKEKGITDLLFINNIFAANTDIRINEIEKIMNQTYVPYVPKPKPPVQTEPKEDPESPEDVPKTEADPEITDSPEDTLDGDITDSEEETTGIIKRKTDSEDQPEEPKKIIKNPRKKAEEDIPVAEEDPDFYEDEDYSDEYFYDDETDYVEE